MTRLTLAGLSYLVALAGCGAFGLFILLQGVGAWHAIFGHARPSPWIWRVSWLLLFTAQHSGMARERFKLWLTRFIPHHLVPSFYAALTGLLLLALPIAWQPASSPPLWELPMWVVVIPGAAGLALVLINLRYDHLGLFGVRQALSGDAPEPPDPLIVSGPYRYVRHPLMACLLVFLWAQPVMTPDLALLAAGLTAYIFLGTDLEERDLIGRFGPDYRAYRRTVPRLIPWRWPADSGEEHE